MITVFSTKTCGYCKVVKQYLTTKGKEYQVVDLEDNPEIRQSLFEKTGALTVPITQIGEEYIVGWNRSRFAEVL
jgi:glutaredoxin